MNNPVIYPSCMVWKPSIIANGFRCTNCGTKLWDGDEATKGLVLENKPLAQDPVGRCKTCGYVALMIKEERK